MSGAVAGRRGLRVEFVAAVAVDLAASAAVLVLSTRTWQSVLLPRPRPLADDVLHVSGRTVTAAPTAFALVALAGVVAVLASRRFARRVVGLVLVGAGAGVVVSSAGALTRLSDGRIRSLAGDRHIVGLGASDGWRVSVHSGWASGCIAAGVLIALAGVLVCVRGARWPAMSARYGAPTGRSPAGRGAGRQDGADEEQRQARAQVSMWSALERGDDPTLRGDDPTLRGGTERGGTGRD